MFDALERQGSEPQARPPSRAGWTPREYGAVAPMPRAPKAAGPVAVAGRLELRGVGKAFRVDGQTLSVLEGLDLVVRPGSFTTLVGPSGCGKSTILRLVAGLETPDRGEIRLDDGPISGPGLERGLVFQEHRLLPWLTIEQNVMLGLEADRRPKAQRKAIVQEHLALVGLIGFERAYPRQLSGGMAQRAAIARALVNRPEVLLLDEPLGALDSLTRAHVQQELLRIWRQEQVTMVMVTHDIEEAVFLSDQVVVLGARPGRVKAVVPINLPHPRDRLEPEFARLRQSILDVLGA